MPHTLFEGGPSAESAVQRLVKLACAVFAAPAGHVSLYDGDTVFFRSLVGMTEEDFPSSIRANRMLTAGGNGAFLVIPDTLADPRFRDHPLVASPAAWRFYAGAAMTDAQGRVIGSIGVMDKTTRAPLRADEEATLQRLAFLAVDIFDLNRDERASAHEIETLKLAEAMAGVGHFSVEVGTGKVAWSDEVYRIHGFEPGQVDPTTESAIGAYHPEDAVVVRGLIAHALETGEGYDAKLRLMRADDEERVTRTKARCEFDERGKVTALFGVFQDITDSVRAQDALVEARRVAEAAAEAKTDFLANVSHELRTPLTSIIGFSAFLKNSPTLSDNERHYADRISAASNALLGVINDVLDYSKLEAGAVDLDAAPFDPRAMAESAAALVGYQCAEKGLALAIEAAPDVPKTLLGDELRLRQVTLNFLSNAVKFTEVGQIAVGLSMNGRRLRVSVADTGIGIADDVVDRLFERFTQADASTTRQYGGTGLGLAISTRLIEMMHGEIGVESRPGDGATFWFEVPAAIAV